MCVGYTDLNKACPKDSYPLPKIAVWSTLQPAMPLMSFMDAYSGFHQIPLWKKDQENTAFFTDQGLFCYTVMLFGLKNAPATFQCMINTIFINQIRRNAEAYIDDMIVKSKQWITSLTCEKHSPPLGGTRSCSIPRSVSLVLSLGSFSDFLLQRGIEANPEKVQAVIDMKSPRTIKEVQKLTGCLATLGRFLGRSSDKCLYFFQAIKKKTRYEWGGC